LLQSFAIAYIMVEHVSILYVHNSKTAHYLSTVQNCPRAVRLLFKTKSAPKCSLPPTVGQFGGCDAARQLRVQTMSAVDSAVLAAFASLSLSDSSCEHNSDAVRKVEAYVQHATESIASAACNATVLQKLVKTHAAQLQRIAQAGLKNRAIDASTSLDLACQALYAMVQLGLGSHAPAAGASVPSLWRLLYQALARCVDLKCFKEGLQVSQALQRCISEKHAAVIDKENCVPAAASGACAFGAPPADCALDLAKLASGAIINTCNCCLGSGSEAALASLVQSSQACSSSSSSATTYAAVVGRGCEQWLDSVAAAGDGSTADSYRQQLFQLLWRAAALPEEKHSAALLALRCRCRALELHSSKQQGWDPAAYVSNVLRAGAAAERALCSQTTTAKAAASSTAKQRSKADQSVKSSTIVAAAVVTVQDVLTFYSNCYDMLCHKQQCRQWPLDIADGESGTALVTVYIDWLMHYAAVHTRRAAAAGTADASVLVQTAYDYVMSYINSSCAVQSLLVHAYASILALQAADLSSTASSEADAKSAQQRKLARRGAQQSLVSMQRGLEHLGQCCDAAEALLSLTASKSTTAVAVTAAAAAGENSDTAAVAAAVTALLKAWRTGHRAPATVERLLSTLSSSDAPSSAASADMQPAAYAVLGDLSRALATLRARAVGCSSDSKQPLIADSLPLVDVAFDSYVKAAAAYAPLLEAEAAVDSSGVSSSDMWNRAEQSLLTAEELITSDIVLHSCSSSSSSSDSSSSSSSAAAQQLYRRRLGAAWFSLGKAFVLHIRQQQSSGASSTQPLSSSTACGISTMARGCQLLERWLQTAEQAVVAAAVHSAACAAVSSDSDSCVHDELETALQTVKLDLRLSLLASYLKDCGEVELATAAARRAVGFCAALCRPDCCYNSVCSSSSNDSNSGDDVTAVLAAVTPLVEAYTALQLVDGVVGSSSSSSSSGKRSKAVKAMTAQLNSYLHSGISADVNNTSATASLWQVLASRAGGALLHTGAAAVAVIEECQCYSAALWRAKTADALSACVVSHSSALAALLQQCDAEHTGKRSSSSSSSSSNSSRVHRRALLQGAQFAHELYCASVDMGCDDALNSDSTASLAAGLQYADAAVAQLIGTAAASELIECAQLQCARGLLLRDSKDSSESDTAFIAALCALEQLCNDADDVQSVSSCEAVMMALQDHFAVQDEAQLCARVLSVCATLSHQQQQQRRQQRQQQQRMRSNADECESSTSSSDSECSDDSHTGSSAITSKQQQFGRSVMMCEALLNTLVPAVAAVCKQLQSGLALLHSGSDSWPYARAERALVAAAEAAQALLTVMPAVKSSHAAAHLCVCAAHMALAALTEAQGQFGASLQHLHTGLQLCARRSRGHNSSSSSSSSSSGHVSCHVINFNSLNTSSKFSCTAEDEEPAVHEEGIGAASSSVASELDAATAAGTAANRDSTAGGSDGSSSSSSSESGVLLQSRWLALYLDGVAAMGRLYIVRGCPGKGSGYLKQWARLSEQAMADKRGRRSMVAQASLLRAEGRGERATALLQRRRAMLPQRAFCSVCSASAASSGSTATAAVAVAVQQSTKQQQQQRVYGSGKQCRGRATAKGRVTATVTTTVTTAVSKSEAVCTSALCSCGGYWGGAVEQAELLCAEGDLHRSEHRFEQAAECYASGVQLLSSTRTATAATAGTLLAELKQRQGRAASLLGDDAAAVQLYEECLATAGASPLTCATALYRLSRACLDGVSSSGSDDVQQQQPQQMLERALALASQSGAFKLLRRVKRLLAEVTVAAAAAAVCSDDQQAADDECAATSVCVSDTWHTAALTSLSVGIALCNQMARKAARQSADSGCTSDCAGVRLFAHCSGEYSSSSSSSTSSSSSSSTDDHSGAAVLQQAVKQSLPAEWTVVSLCITPTGGLLLTRVTPDHPPLTVSISVTTAQCSTDDDTAAATATAAAGCNNSVASVLAEWRHVLELNRQTLRGSTTARAGATATSSNTAESSRGSNRAKAEWWSQRADVDTAIDAVMTRVQQHWFADSGIVAVLLGAVADAAVNKRLTAVWLQVHAMLQHCTDTTMSSAWLELVRVCVHGGDVMCLNDWQQLLAIAGCDTALAADIHSLVTAAFTVAEHNYGNASHSSTTDSHRSSSSSSDTTSVGSSSNTSRVTAAAATVAAVPTETELTKLTVPQLKARLQSHGVSITGLKRKADYIQLLLGTLHSAAAASSATLSSDDSVSDGDANCSSGSSSSSSDEQQRTTEQSQQQQQQQQQQLSTARHPVILVLDEQLQSMPFEALPCLRGHPVTRLPALPFLFTALSATWSARTSSSTTSTTADSDDVGDTSEATWSPALHGIRLHSGFYVLDPEQNLPTSRATLQPALEALQHSRGWSGAVGSAATSSSFQLATALSQHDLFVYCGHGAGELLLGRDDVAALQNCAAAVIMGCSSGRLKSSGCFEPAGMVSGYLTAGSPAVVANLWDVTDRDIDRYCLALLRLFAEAVEPASLAHAVAQARSECKLKHVIGYAPVCYGIPVMSATAASSCCSSSRTSVSSSVKASSKSTSTSSDSNRSSRKRR
jgi:Peptidase family C50